MDVYEISLWENIWVEDVSAENGGYYDEQKICIIGANDMTTPIRAIEPKLVDNINGTHTFSFKMYKRYTDNVTGETLLNPFDKYLTNERKIKVYWKNVWYDFIIKKIQENSSDKSLTYTCQDLFIYELSKNGYDLNFDTDLRNNIGSAQKLIKSTIDGTTWKFDEENSEEMLQTYEGAVVEATTLNSIDTINQTYIAQHNSEANSNFTVESGKKILVFYDSIVDIFQLDTGYTITKDIQLVCDNSNNFVTELNSNLVINNYCLQARMTIKNWGTYYDFKQDNTVCFQLQKDFTVSSKYRGERFINTDVQVYDDDLGRYVVECKDVEDPTNKVYRTEVTHDNNPLDVTNLVANPTDFKNTEGWEPASTNINDKPLGVKVYPDDFPANIEYQNFNVESALKLKGKIYNNGFIANASKFKVTSYEQKQGQLSGIQEGDQYTFRIRGFKNQIIPASEYVFPEIDRTPIEVISEAEDTDWWDTVPLYIYEYEYQQLTDPGSVITTLNQTDMVGRVLGLGQANSIFNFDQLYKIVNYGDTPVKFGLHMDYIENNKIRISNYTGSTYGILSTPLELKLSQYPYYGLDSPRDTTIAQKYYKDYGFTFIDNQMCLVLYKSASGTEVVNPQTGDHIITSLIASPSIKPLDKTPAEIFGPQKNNQYYEFIRKLLKRQYQNVESDTLNDLNRRTFTEEEMKFFYTQFEAQNYHPNTLSESMYYNNRTFILTQQVHTGGNGNSQHDYYPDFISINDFFIFSDPSSKGFQLLIDNVAEQIAVDPPLLDEANYYKSLVSSLAAIKKKNNALQKKAGRGYYYINNTDKTLSITGLVDEYGPSGNGFTTDQYVILITTIKDNIYDSEHNKLVWDNYQSGDYVAHLFKCKSGTSYFDANDETDWELLDKKSEDFPLLSNGHSWVSRETVYHGGEPYDYKVINEEVLDNSKNLYGYEGSVEKFVAGGYREVESSEVWTYVSSMGIPTSVAAALAGSGVDLSQLSSEALDELMQQAGEALAQAYSAVYSQIPKFSSSVYSLGAYVTSLSYSDSDEENEEKGYGLHGEFDTLLLNTFQPLIPAMERVIASYFDYSGDLIDALSSVNEAEINRYIDLKEYDSDFPNLSSFIDQNDYTVSFLLDGEPIFSFSEPVISNDYWIQYTLTCIKTVPIEKIKIVEFFLNTTANASIWLDNIQLFKNQYIEIGGVDNLIYPGKEFLWKDTEVLYMYYKKTNSGMVTLYTGPDLQSNYPAITSNYYKMATINIKRSNRFNILQTIAEAFNGWIYFDIKHENNGKIKLDENNYPEKYVGILQKKGTPVNITFEYGIDLKNIQRTIDSNQLTTKVYVLQNSNEFGKNGFCTISRSRQNLTKASFILDFSYFIQTQLIDEEQLNKDLYEWYYPQMNYLYEVLDTKENELIDCKEKITRLQAQQQIYDSYISAAEDEIGSLQAEKYSLTKGLTGYSTNKIVQSLSSSISKANNKLERYETYYTSLSNNIDNLQSSIDTLEEDTNGYREALEELHEKFNNIYWPFIFEGTWIDEKYIDDDQYYLDGLSVAHNSAHPQLTYTINVIRLGSLPEFSVKQFHVGDICYIVDKEFFGYKEDGITPIKERIIINEITSYFDSPEKDNITVRNYRSKFDDLFQKIVATTQNLKFSEGEYTKVTKAITPERTISYDLLQDTFDHNENIVLNAANQNVTWDETGITISNNENGADKTRIIAGGIFITNDGGKTWKNAVRGDGISADLLTAGRINSGEIYIYDKEYPMFRWDSTGINAYSCAREEQVEGSSISTYSVNFSKFVRFDKFGLYGYNNPSNEAYLDDFIPQSEEDIWTNPYTKFGLTWKGFFLKSTSEGGGYVKISTDGDMIKYANGVLDRKIISSGILDKETFYLTQNGNAVFSGELKAARGSFMGDSNTSLLTLDNNGLVLKVLNKNIYQDIFRIEYIQTGNYVYPYLETIGGSDTSIILQTEHNLFIGPKNFIGLNGLTIGTIVSGSDSDSGVFVDAYYKTTDYSTSPSGVVTFHKRTYNLAKTLFKMETLLGTISTKVNIIGQGTIQNYQDLTVQSQYFIDEVVPSYEYNFLTHYIDMD